ncbi:hypothetical protein K431DRAFT_129107 [Polychaeton citri CBS 116435]|uniref:Uncharacterized protein n=1 Tax=Polychaeton citri CBS 116435 TaxID=1314669 RepID=A0A9P4Q5Y7_9PEZI|nr:hypothetical protein K431DRAFT_129107 [Polychaeton citri CBS 116435]
MRRVRRHWTAHLDTCPDAYCSTCMNWDRASHLYCVNHLIPREMPKFHPLPTSRCKWGPHSALASNTISGCLCVPNDDAHAGNSSNKSTHWDFPSLPPCMLGCGVLQSTCTVRSARPQAFVPKRSVASGLPSNFLLRSSGVIENASDMRLLSKAARDAVSGLLATSSRSLSLTRRSHSRVEASTLGFQQVGILVKLSHRALSRNGNLLQCQRCLASCRCPFILFAHRTAKRQLEAARGGSPFWAEGYKEGWRESAVQLDASLTCH